MGAVTRENITDKQFQEVLYYFHTYKQILDKTPESKLQGLGIAKRAMLRKHINNVKKLWTELDNI